MSDDEVKDLPDRADGLEGLLINAVEQSGDAIIVTDRQGMMEYLNPAFERMYGYRADELVGKPVMLLDPFMKHMAWKKQFLRPIRQGMPWKGTEWQTRKNGERFLAEVTVTAIRRQSSGTYEHFVTIKKDVTRQRAREWMDRRLLRLRAMAQKNSPVTQRLQMMLDNLMLGFWKVSVSAGAIFQRVDDSFELMVSRGWNERKRQRFSVLPDQGCLCAQRMDATLKINCAQHTACEPESISFCIAIMERSTPLGLICLCAHCDGDRSLPDEFIDFICQAQEVIGQMMLMEQALEKVRVSENKYRQLVEFLPVGVVIHGDYGVVRYVNQYMTQIGAVADPDIVIGRNVMEYIDEEYHPVARARLQKLMQGQSVPPVQERLKRQDGSTFWAEVRATPIEFEGQSAILSLVQDIDAQKKTKERLEWLSYYDELTCLPNRRLLADRLGRVLAAAKREDAFISLLYLDLDRFKVINDSLGHHMGDLLLKEVARRLKQGVREADTVARMGGDEFIILLPDTDANDALRVANKIRIQLQQPMLIEQHELAIDVSIGISMFPEDGVESDSLLKHADTAVYFARQQQTHIHCFSSSMEKKVRRRMQLEQELAKAIERDQLSLYYQPQHAMAENEMLLGVEALLRWQHPVLGMVSPAEFIPLAEETGLIHAVTDWVLTEAGRVASEWEAKDIRPDHIAVNLSAIQLARPDLASMIIDRVTYSGAKVTWFEFEITETAIMCDAHLGERIMRQLNDAGCSIAIDDFGTGYSSLANLKRIPAHWLKIDLSFIQGLPEASDDIAIVRSIIAMAHALELKTMAEGVETRKQWKFLQAEGCDAVQGYLLSKPLPAEEMTIYLQRRCKEFPT